MPVQAIDPFLHSSKGPLTNSPGTIGPITPSDADELPRVCRVVFCNGVAGNVALVLVDGSECTLPIEAGARIDWLFVRQVKATGTTATGLWGFI